MASPLRKIKSGLSKRKEIITIFIFVLAIGFLIYLYYNKLGESTEPQVKPAPFAPPQVPQDDLKYIQDSLKFQQVPIENNEKYKFILKHNLFDPVYAQSYYEQSKQKEDYIDIAERSMRGEDFQRAFNEFLKVTDDESFILLRPRAILIMDSINSMVLDNDKRRGLLTAADVALLQRIAAGIRSQIGGFRQLNQFEQAIQSVADGLNAGGNAANNQTEG